MAEPLMEIRDGKEIHFSVGAIIMRGEEMLLIDRATPPFGMAGPAGHVDVGETSDEAIDREVNEEIGLMVVKHELLIAEFVPWNTCGKGVEGHDWKVYRCEVEGELKRNQRETKSVGWFDPKKVKNWEPVWEYWLKKLEMI